MYKTIAIDGACRRNGQPDCIAAGACFILDTDEDIEQCSILLNNEDNSTSQRGELWGLSMAIEHVRNSMVDTVIVTDSEYLFNTMTKGWLDRWVHNGWQTAQGTEVKNADLWKELYPWYNIARPYITFYHIKGHLLSVGVKKYHELLRHDGTGYELYKWAYENKHMADEKKQHAIELSERNNGFAPDDELLQRFAAMNLVADAYANILLENVETQQWLSILNNSVPAASNAL